MEQANKKTQDELKIISQSVKMIFKTQLEKAEKQTESLTNIMTQQKGLAETLNVTNLKLYRDLQPNENPSQRDGTKFFHTPDSQNSKEGTRRLNPRSDWTNSHQSSSRQQSVENSPSLREYPKTPDERYSVKRPRDFSPEPRPDPLYRFDQVYGQQLCDGRFHNKK